MTLSAPIQQSPRPGEPRGGLGWSCGNNHRVGLLSQHASTVLNVVSCKVIVGYQWTPLIGTYLTQSTLDHLPDLEKVLNRFLGRDPVVLEYLNSDIVHLRNPKDKHVADFSASFGLVDLLGHFWQRLHYRHLQMWWKIRQGQVLCCLCDNILGLDWWMFEMVGIWDPQNFASNNFSLWTWLLRRPTCCHGGHLQGRCTFPLVIPQTVPLNLLYINFRALKAMETPSPPPHHLTAPPGHNGCPMGLYG